jgi:CubicO group peptidase (beta-lactamase class C family)
VKRFESLVALLVAGCASGPPSSGARTAAAAPRAAAVASAVKPAEPAFDLQTVLARVDRDGVPALAAAWVRSEGPAYAAAVGARRSIGGTPVQPSDVFRIGSCTKSMTATLAAMLVEDGRIGWDTPLGQALPDLAPSMHAAHRGVSLEQLLTHRAGLAASTSVFERPAAFLLPGNRQERVRALLSAEPAYAPGTSFLYSNAGPVVAAVALERAATAPYEELVEHRIFVPLGMQSCRFGHPAAASPDAPLGHVRLGPLHLPRPPRDAVPAWANPAGGASCSVGDVATYARMHLRGLRGHDGLLRSETVRRLHTPAPWNGATDDERYGAGWRLLGASDGTTASWHNGSEGTYYAEIVILPSADLAVVVVANAGASSAEAPARRARRAILRGLGLRLEHEAHGRKDGPP